MHVTFHNKSTAKVCFSQLPFSCWHHQTDHQANIIIEFNVSYTIEKEEPPHLLSLNLR